MGHHKGPVGPRHSVGGTVVPSFRFNKADDEIVEVTPTSSFEETEETAISHCSNAPIQDLLQNIKENNLGYDAFDGDTTFLDGPLLSIQNDDSLGGLYTGDVKGEVCLI